MIEYLYIGMLLAAMGLLTTFVFIFSKLHYMVRVGLGIVMVVMSLGIWTNTQSILGYPTNANPPDHFMVRGFEIINREAIIIWVDDDHGPRLFRLQWSKETAKELNDLFFKIRERGGQGVQGKRGGVGPGNGTSLGTDTTNYHFNVIDTLPVKKPLTPSQQDNMEHYNTEPVVPNPA